MSEFVVTGFAVAVASAMILFSPPITSDAALFMAGTHLIAAVTFSPPDGALARALTDTCGSLTRPVQPDACGAARRAGTLW